MKGAHPTLSHSMLLLLGLLALSLIIVSISNSLSTIERDLVSTELNFIADSVKDKVLEAYSLTNQSSNYTTGLFQLDLPEKIGNRRYSISFNDKMLLVNTSVKNRPIEVVRVLPVDAEFSGTQFLPASIKIEKKDEKISIGLIK